MTEDDSVVPESRKCRICSAPTVSVHFGIDACRACSSFFKRTQISRHRYPCRKGDHKCDVLRADGSMCRGCRYDKCTSIGMEYDGPMRKYLPKCTASESILSCSSGKKESLINRIGREHKNCVGRRRIQEAELVKLHNLARVPHPTEVSRVQVDFDCALAIFNVTVIESWKFFLEAFPDIKKLPYADQREFFRLCMPQFAIADCFCRTKRIWGGWVQYSMSSVLVCTDINNPEGWVGAHGGPMREELLEAIRAYIHDQMTLMLPSFDKADICEREMHALLALMLVESDPENGFADRFQSFFESVRKEILEDLHNFYTEEMKLADYSARLGNLLTICHTFREGNTLFQEFFRMQVTVFDLYIADTALKDLLL